MKKLIKNIAMAITLFCGLNAYSQAPVTTTSCEARCIFGSCSATCTAKMGAAACACYYGVPICACGGGGGVANPVTVNEHQLENVNSLMTHLQTYNSVEALNLRNKVSRYRNQIQSNETNLSVIAQEIVIAADSLNVIEKSRLNTFIQTLVP